MARNGFTQPSSKHQVASRLLLVAFSTVYYGLFAVNLKRTEYLSLLVGYSVLLGLVLIVKHTRSNKLFPLAGDIKQVTVYCVLCKSKVLPRSRHCRKCQRCVSKLDHHCVWLNNCIGEGNYPWFFLLVCVLECALIVQIYSGAVTLRELFTSPKSHLFAKFDFGESGYCFASVLAAATAISIVAAVYDSVLLAFHVYLCFRNITTIEYMTQRRRKVAPAILGVTTNQNLSISSHISPTVNKKLHADTTNDSKDMSVCIPQKQGQQDPVRVDTER